MDVRCSQPTPGVSRQSAQELTAVPTA
jgi:hypothetical protein